MLERATPQPEEDWDRDGYSMQAVWWIGRRESVI